MRLVTVFTIIAALGVAVPQRGRFSDPDQGGAERDQVRHEGGRNRLLR